MYWWVPYVVPVNNKYEKSEAYERCAFLELYKCSAGTKNKKSYIEKDYRDAYSREMSKNCKQFTKEELKALKPKIIITIGKPAMKFIEDNQKELSVKNVKKIHLKHTSRFPLQNPLHKNKKTVNKRWIWSDMKHLKKTLKKIVKND